MAGPSPLGSPSPLLDEELDDDDEDEPGGDPPVLEVPSALPEPLFAPEEEVSPSASPRVESPIDDPEEVLA